MNTAHAEFMNRLRTEGVPAQKFVAERFRRSGLTAEIQDVRICNRYEDRHYYNDEGDDVLVEGRRIEVKSARTTVGKIFTDDPASFPFDTIYVCRKGQWDGYPHKPVAAVCVCWSTKGCLVVPTSTFSSWSVVQTIDRRRGTPYEVYACPTGLVRTFDSLVEWLASTGSAHAVDNRDLDGRERHFSSGGAGRL